MSDASTWKRPLAIALAIMVVAIGAVATSLENASTRSQVDEWSLRQAQVVEALVQDVIQAEVADLEAIAGFVAVSDPVPDPEAFSDFVDRIDGAASSFGIGIMAVVDAADVERHIAERRQTIGEFYEILGLGADGLPIPVEQTGRDVFYPVQLFAFGDLVEPFLSQEIPISILGVGVDAGYAPEWREQIEIATSSTQPVLSDFIEVSFEVFSLDRAFFVSVPVDTEGKSTHFVGALMLEPHLLQGIDSKVLDEVEWEIVPPGEVPARVDADTAHFYPIELPGTTWRLAIEPTDAALAGLVGIPAWLLGLLSSAVAALIIVSAWLFFERRTELRRAAMFRRAVEDKDRFLASVSHELRTPLTVVSGLAHELSEARSQLGEEELAELFDLLIEQSDELSGIVEDLLIAARTDIGKVAIHLSEVDIAAEARRAAEDAGVDITTNGHAIPARADAQRVRQILRNLLSNAQRYGGDSIYLRIDSSDSWVDVTVGDDGEGVPSHKQETIFESYESAHQPDAAVRSVGLGLYIARNLAQAMGGDLTYEYVDGWSLFRLRLAASQTRQEAVQLSSVD